MDKIIEGLIDLQKLDIRILVIEEFLASVPAAKAGFDEELSQAQGDMDRKREELDETKRQLQRAEGVLSDREEKIRLVQAKLNQVKTNKEYEAALKEIEERKRQIGEAEEEILRLYDKVEEVQKERSRLESGWKEWKREFEERKSGLDRREAVAQKESGERGSERESLVGSLDPESLKLYEKLRQAKGRALARADKEVCLGCYVHVPAQLYNEVLQGSKVINCSGCQRILVHLPEELDDGLTEITA